MGGAAVKRCFLRLLLSAIVLANVPCLAGPVPEGFVHVKAAVFWLGTGARQSSSRVRIEDFEILDHSVAIAPPTRCL